MVCIILGRKHRVVYLSLARWSRCLSLSIVEPYLLWRRIPTSRLTLSSSQSHSHRFWGFDDALVNYPSFAVMDQASVPVKVKRHFKARDFWKLLWLALRNGLAVVYRIHSGQSSRRHGWRGGRQASRFESYSGCSEILSDTGCWFEINGKKSWDEERKWIIRELESK